jgi:hypothetical protein
MAGVGDGRDPVGAVTQQVLPILARAGCSQTTTEGVLEDVHAKLRQAHPGARALSHAQVNIRGTGWPW